MLEVKIGELNKDNVFVQHFVIWSSISHSKPTSARHYNYFHKTSYIRSRWGNRLIRVIRIGEGESVQTPGQPKQLTIYSSIKLKYLF